jgi:hypothetical protein
VLGAIGLQIVTFFLIVPTASKTQCTICECRSFTGVIIIAHGCSCNNITCRRQDKLQECWNATYVLRLEQQGSMYKKYNSVLFDGLDQAQSFCKVQNGTETPCFLIYPNLFDHDVSMQIFSTLIMIAACIALVSLCAFSLSISQVRGRSPYDERLK